MTRDLSRKLLVALPLTLVTAIYMSPIVHHYSLTAAELCRTMWLHYWFYLLPVPLVIATMRLGTTVVKSRKAIRRLAIIGHANAATELPPAPPAASALIFDSSSPIAFTAGFLGPRVYISNALAGSLSREELQTVIAHESEHAQRRDPLWSLLATFGRDLLLPIPIVHWLYRHHRLETEFHCDAAACKQVGDRLTVASTILKVQKMSIGMPAPLPGFSGLLCATVEMRIKRLLGQKPGAAMWAAPALLGLASLLIVSVLTSLALYGHESLTCLVTTL